jgi:hypothetical protein
MKCPDPASTATLRAVLRWTRYFCLPAAWMVLLFCAPSAYCQLTAASISGAVTDVSGASLAGALVSAQNRDTGQIRAVATDGRGEYRILGLMSGEYAVSAALRGFNTELRSGVKLAVGQELDLAFTLQVQGPADKAVVGSEPAPVEITGSGLSGVVNDSEIRDLPLNARSFIQLSFLQPGVMEYDFTRPNVNQGRGVKITVNGLRPTSNGFLLDGTYVNDAIGRTPGSTAGVFLGIDTVREFRVITNAYGAQYGMAAGGVVSAVTKSGTNRFQGSAYYFHRNDALDARNFFDSDKPEFRRHQFGGTLGGPIRQDRTFFFAAGEWLRQARDVTHVVQVPSVAARSGEIAPISDAARPYLDLYPIPNGPDLGGGLAEHRFTQGEPADESFAQFRLDHSFSANDRVFSRYTFDDADVVLPAPNPNTLAAADESSRNQYLTLEYQRIASSRLLVNSRAAFNRTNVKGENLFLQPVNPSLSFVAGRELGSLRIGGIGDWGPNRSLPVRRLRNYYSLDEELAWAGGHHSVKAGATVARIQDNNVSQAYWNGAYEFADVTRFLQGISSTFQITTPVSVTDRSWRQWLFAFYGQDEFRAARTLTLNFGLRYEFATVATEANGRMQNLQNPMTDAQMTLGDPMYENPGLFNLMPRIGLAWDPGGTGKTVVRAGFGVFDDPYLYAPLYPAHQQASPFVQRAILRNPQFPHQYVPDIIPNSSQSIIISDYRPRNPHALQYNIGVESEIFRQGVISIAYVGSRGINLLRGGSVNRPIPQTVNGRLYFPAGSPRRNPNWSDIDLKRTDGNSWYSALQLAFRRQYSRGLQFQASYTFSRTIDEGSGSIGDDVSTGAADPQDPDNRSNERGLASFHSAQRLALNFTYDLPSWPWKEGVAGALVRGWQINGILAIRSGMPFTVGVESDRSRSLIRTAGQLRPDLLPGADMSGAVLGADAFRQTGLYFDPFVFTLPSPGFLGNVGRNTLIGPGLATLDFSLVKNFRPRFLGDDGQLQFRFETFNLLNRANFSAPSPIVFAGTATVPDPACMPQFECPLSSAGRITATVTDAREVQVGIKLLF